MKSKSCIYLQKAIYLAPNEIRACCQRFFVNGKIKGDVPLIKLINKRNVSFEEVINAKKNLLERINNETDVLCSGCPHLSLEEWGPVENEAINVISIEDHSLCNMKCTYCSEIYYGGVSPQYDLKILLENLPKIDADLHIAWGGGEPTIRKDFEDLFTYLTKNFKPRTQRIFTNALKYSKSLQEALDNKLATITTSIDAGTEDTFKKIRGSSRLDLVLHNLHNYSRNNSELITIKYIFTENNYDFNEVQAFVNNLINFDLLNCNFLISTDFKSHVLSNNKVLGIIILYYLLTDKGVLAVNFDDHIYSRLRSIGSFIYNIKLNFKHHKEINYLVYKFSDLLDYHLDKNIVIWGTGEFAKYLITSSIKIKEKEIKIHGIVDTNIHKIGTLFMGMTIQSPDTLIESDSSILIASSNYYGEIVKKALHMGISPKRIAPNFIV